MTSRPGIEELKRLVAERFPMEAQLVDAEMDDFDEDAYEIWLEKFCDTTNAAMQRRDAAQVDAHLLFISQRLASADEHVRRTLDVAYVENLMCNLDPDGKRWAWPRIPANLKALYSDLWGTPKI